MPPKERRSERLGRGPSPAGDTVAPGELLDGALDLVQSVGSDGRFRYVNRRWREALGYVGGEVATLHLLDIVRPDHRPMCEGLFRRVASGEAIPRVETVFVSKDGREVPVEGSASPIMRDGRFVATVGVFRPLEERERTESALRASKGRLHAVLGALPDLVFVVARDGTFLEYHGSRGDLYAPPERFLGKRVSDVLPAGVARLAMEGVRRALSERALQQFEYELPVGGEARHYECRMVPIDEGSVLALVRDVTRRRGAERALRDSEEMWRTLFENAPDGIYLHDMKGNFIDGNRAAEELIGYRKEELVGRNFLELGLLSPSDVPKAALILSRLVVGRPTDPLPVTLTRKDGSRVDVELRGFPLRVGDRTVVMGIARDVSSRARAERALRESEENFRALADNANDGIAILAGEPARCAYANRRTAELLGYRVEELSSLGLGAVVAPQELEEVTRRYRERLKGGQVPPRYEITLMRRDGTPLCLELAASRTVWQGRPADLVILRDVTERSRAEAILRASEARHRTLVEASTDAVLVEGLDGRILDCNTSACEMFGYSKEELCAMNAVDLVPEDVAGLLPGVIRTQLGRRRGPSFVRSLGRRSDGGVFPSEVSFRVATVDGQRLVYAYVRDVTERARHERELREERDRAQDYLNVAGVVIVALDASGRVTLINRKGCEVLGRGEGEILGRDWFEGFVPEREREGAREAFRRLMSGELSGAGSYENAVLARDGGERLVAWHNTVLVDEEGRIVGTLSSGDDVTERRRAEERLVRQEALSRSLLESMHDGIVLVDAPEGGVTYVNPAFCRMTGFRREELLGRGPPLPFWAPEELERSEAVFRLAPYAAVAGGREMELELQRKDGSRIRCLVTPAPLLAKDGSTSGLVGLFKDITERKRAEDEMRRRLMRYRLEEGCTYLVQEQAPSLATEAFKDLLKAGYPGLAFSRAPEAELSRAVGGGFAFQWLAEAAGEQGTPGAIERRVGALSERSAVLVDRLDYIVQRHGFERALELVARLRELSYLNGHIVVASMDPSTMGRRELRLLEKEGRAIEPMLSVTLPEDLLEVLRFLYRQNLLGVKPTNTAIGGALGISQPTVRKRLRQLVAAGHAHQRSSGRSKVAELTERGRALFASQ